MGLADPGRGAISCGGIDLREMDLTAWREQIAWVPQRPTLFTGTIAEFSIVNPDGEESTTFADAGGAVEADERTNSTTTNRGDPVIIHLSAMARGL